MSATDFLDSNVVLYLLAEEPAKAEVATALLADGCTISVQVLDEIAAVASRKFRMPLPDIRGFLLKVRAFCVIAGTDLETHERGLDLAERYKFSIYDSMLLAAALKSGCRTFYTEDLHHGQKIEGLTIRNPFRD